VEGEGVAEGDAPPVACDDRTGQNILWKAPVANWGHAQPVIVGDRLFVLSEGGWPAEQDLPLLQAFEAANGREAWRKTLDHLPATGLSEADQKAARDGWHNIHDRMRKAYVLFNGYICATNAAGKEAATARFKELGM
jgi:outer membrane protein assembly factor BamB